MKQTLTFLSAMLLMGTLLQNCSCKHHCMNPAPVAKLVDFDSAERHMVIVKKYNNDGRFTEPQNTTVYTSTPKVFYGSDTTYIGASDYIVIDAFTDYTIDLPGAGKNYVLKNVGTNVAQMTERCTSGLKYTLNNVNYILPAQASPTQVATVIEIKK